MRKKVTMAAAVLALLFAPCAAWAQTAGQSYYVSASGNDENDGLTEAAAFKRLFYAVLEARNKGVRTVTVIGTLNQASENADNKDYVFPLITGVRDDNDPILITGIPNAPAGRRAVLSAAGTTKNGVDTVLCSFRFEHIEISGSSKTGLEVGVNSSVILGPGSLVRNNSGGGVIVSSLQEEWRDTLKPGSLILDGGIIENNKRDRGAGGIFVTGAFTMKRGSVRNNGAVPDKDRNSFGGGIMIISSDPVFIEGGDISGNTATLGGGIWIESGRVTMSGGSITNNSATLGGGAGVLGGATFTQTGGSITGNRAPQFPNIFAEQGATISLLPGPSGSPMFRPYLPGQLQNKPLRRTVRQQQMGFRSDAGQGNG
jgi:hypothetical protein